MIFSLGTSYERTIFFFFWTGLCDPISCSLLGGGIPSQNSCYKSTRLCHSLSLGFCYYVVPPCSFFCLLYVLVDYSSAPLHSSPLKPLAPQDSSSPPNSSFTSTSDSSYDFDSDSDIVVVSVASFFAPSKSMLSCSRHRQDTLAPGRQVALS